METKRKQPINKSWVGLVWLKLSHSNRLKLKRIEWKLRDGGCDATAADATAHIEFHVNKWQEFCQFLLSVGVCVCARVVYINMPMQTCVLANKDVIANVGLHIVIDLLLLLYVFKSIHDWTPPHANEMVWHCFDPGSPTTHNLFYALKDDTHTTCHSKHILYVILLYYYI